MLINLLQNRKKECNIEQHSSSTTCRHYKCRYRTKQSLKKRAVYELPWATMTEYAKLGGVEKQKLFLHGSGGQKSWSGCWQCHAHSETLGRILPRFFQLLEGPSIGGVPRLTAASLGLCFRHHTVSPLSLCLHTAFSSSCKDTSHGTRACPNDFSLTNYICKDLMFK